MTDDPIPDEPSSRESRGSVMLTATIECFGGSGPTKHRIRDLSTGGVRIDQAAAIPVGATLLVTVGALESVGATVVWVRGGSAGLKFVMPINPEDARAKAALAPRTTERPSRTAPIPGATAGWIRDLNNPYRR